jgi:hypothetical protein
MVLGMRAGAIGVLGVVFAVAAAACDGDGSDGGSGTGGSGTGGSGTGGTGGASTGGASTGGASSGGASSGGASTGGASSGGTGGTAGTCSVLKWGGCPVLETCMASKCSAEIIACYGNNYGTDDATGSLCESLWTCSKTCTCGDDSCLVNTCFSAAGSGCQACIPAVTTCMQTHCQAEANQC